MSWPAAQPAPFGRRTVTLTSTRTVGAYRVLSVADALPVPAPGQFYMLATAAEWGGGMDERPFLGRACSVLRTAGGERGAAGGVRGAARGERGAARGERGAARGERGAAEGGADDTTLNLEFMLEVVGPGTDRLCRAREGEQLQVVGPLGTPFRPPPPGVRALLVGGGVGVAPLAILQEALLAADHTTLALLGFRDALHAAGAQLLVDARLCTDDGSAGRHGLVTDLLAQELSRDLPSVVYACGPPPMLEAVRAMCAAGGVACQLALEAPMACGFGACFGCVVADRDGRYLRVCVDGPVIDGARLQTAIAPWQA